MRGVGLNYVHSCVVRFAAAASLPQVVLQRERTRQPGPCYKLLTSVWSAPCGRWQPLARNQSGLHTCRQRLTRARAPREQQLLRDKLGALEDSAAGLERTWAARLVDAEAAAAARLAEAQAELAELKAQQASARPANACPSNTPGGQHPSPASFRALSAGRCKCERLRVLLLAVSGMPAALRAEAAAWDVDELCRAYLSCALPTKRNIAFYLGALLLTPCA